MSELTTEPITRTKPAPLSARSLKIPERSRFVSPMPKLGQSTVDIHPVLTIAAAFAALTSLTLSVLIYLKK